VAYYLVAKKLVVEQQWHLLIDSELTPEQLKFLVEDCRAYEVFWGHFASEPEEACVGEEYELRPLDEGSENPFLEYDNLEECYDFDKDENVVKFLTDFKPTEEG